MSGSGEPARRQTEFGLLDATGRVCRRLVEMMDHFGEERDGAVVVRSPLTQRDVAAWSGLSREAVVKALRVLRRLGWIQTAAHTIVVTDPRSVAARAELAHAHT